MKKYGIPLWIPIVLLILYLSNRHAFMEFSHGILGKLISVSIIVFYSYVDIYLGLLACLMVILYYQTDTVENMLNMMEYASDPYILPTPIPSQQPPYSSAVQTFRDENCQGNTLKYKNIDVKPELAYHIFPSLQFEKEPCNPCSKQCHFSIIESKLKTEDELIPLVRYIEPTSTA